MTSRLYRIHDLVVRSDVALQGQPVAAACPDLVIARGRAQPVPAEPPPGRIIAEAWNGATRFYTAVAGEAGAAGRAGAAGAAGAAGRAGVTVRFHRWCDFSFSANGATITWYPAPEMNEDTVAVMAAGTVLAIALQLRGHPVLHASAVEMGGRALVFVGGSGMGKSTLAALFCHHGAALVTDDVLRIDGDHCFAGATAVRLRAPAAPAFGSTPALEEGPEAPWRTADGRLALPLPTCVAGRLPIGAVILPAVDKQGQSPLAARLAPRAAVLALAAFPRVSGWQDPATGGRQFEALVDLATRVPVWRCRVPWGPPFRPSLATELLDGVGWPERDRPHRPASTGAAQRIGGGPLTPSTVSGPSR